MFEKSPNTIHINVMVFLAATLVKRFEGWSIEILAVLQILKEINSFFNSKEACHFIMFSESIFECMFLIAYLANFVIKCL